jgi:hypothetical protein
MMDLHYGRKAYDNLHIFYLVAEIGIINRNCGAAKNAEISVSSALKSAPTIGGLLEAMFDSLKLLKLLKLHSLHSET